jgi:hypothetical protein
MDREPIGTGRLPPLGAEIGADGLVSAMIGAAGRGHEAASRTPPTGKFRGRLMEGNGPPAANRLRAQATEAKSGKNPRKFQTGV